MIATDDVRTERGGEHLPALGDGRGSDPASAPAWTPWAPRPDLLAVLESSGNGTLRLRSPGNPAVLSALRCRCAVVPNQAYRFAVRFRPSGIASVRDSVRPLLRWFRASGQACATDYVTQFSAATDGWYETEQVVGPHPDATEVEVSLMLRWTDAGNVTWDQPSLRPCAAPAPRFATLGVANVGVALDAPVEECIRHCCDLIAEAGRAGCDLLVLTEMVLGRPTRAEPIPGPAFERFAEQARRHRIWVIPNYYEQDGPRVYNTSSLINRDGELAGKYRKVHLIPGEYLAGVTPGSSTPVFDTDFARLGISVCYDNKFPEHQLALAAQGAELLCSCQEGDWREAAYTMDIVARAKAISTGAYVLSSGRCTPSEQQGHLAREAQTFIISPEGYVLAQAGRDGAGVISRRVELGRSMYIGTAAGHQDIWNDMAADARRPQLYRALSEDFPSPAGRA
jgi:predicted amidohydrolase